MRLFPLLSALGLLTLSACSTDGSKTFTVRLAPYLVPCTSWFPTTCMVALNPDGPENQSFYQGEIEGFTFAWGYRQDLVVESHPVKNPPADGSSIRYELVRVESKAALADWSVRTWRLDTLCWKLSGDTLNIEGYAPKILIRDGNDKAKLAARAFPDGMTLRLNPGIDSVLFGDSVAVVVRPATLM